jgi:uncharacterized protein Yka (UPF0111/DUF47 family)
MYQVSFLPEAVDDIECAAAWYGKQQESLSDDFVNEVIRSIEQIESDIIVYKKVYRQLQRVRTKRYPYAIYFRKEITKKTIVVIGVLHMKQSKSQLLWRM